MQRSKLRLMLLIEARLIAGVGTLVGIVAGAFFGWLGATTTCLLLIAIAAAALAND